MVRAEQSSFKHSSKLWFDDGNVILRTGHTLFRVFGGILALNSVIFRVMLSLPQPPESERYMGCPVVELSDSPEDLGNFLKAIHDASFDCFKVTSYHVLAGIIRLSTKYEVLFLRARAIKTLLELYPSTLSGFDRREKYVPVDSGCPKPALTSFPGRMFEVANLARECNISILLPSTLFFAVVFAGIPGILDGIPAQDGTGRHQLNSADARLCLLAHPALLNWSRQRIFAFLHGCINLGICESPANCNAHRLRILEQMKGGYPEFGAFNPLDASLNWDIIREHMCSSCYKQSKSLFNQERKSLWEELPSIFDLGTWEKLESDSGLEA